MSHPAIWLYEDAQIEDAVHLMSRQQVRRLVVLNHKREAVGVLSLDDLASYTGDDETAGRILEKIARKPMVESFATGGYHIDSSVFP
jgi:CBS domain-containing protein